LAPNKRKILEAARKYAQKGARDRALKEYEKLLKLDPRDAKLRLEIGDAYRRWGQLEDAITTYTRVAEQYMAEGFDARAVAVFKQIHNLEPERWSTYEPLAELYQRMGLAAEASAALQTAADGYHRAGKRREALGLLRKMAAIDPSNTTSRLKVADLLRQEGLSEEAVAEYDGVAEELERQGELEPAVTALARILEIDPAHVSALARATRALASLGELDRAEPLARRLLEAQPDDPEHYEQLAEIYRRQARENELGTVYRGLADLYRRRGDEDRARAITQRFVPPGVMAVPGGDAHVRDAGEAGGLKGDISQFLADDDLGPDTLLDEDLLDPEPPPSVRAPPTVRAPATARTSATARTRSSVRAGPDLAEQTVFQPREPGPPAAGGDPEQLLAEACVYLRYGKRAQAVENLEAIVAAEPRHRRALEKLGEALADSDAERAVDVWLRAAGIAQEEGDGSALDVLRARIAALDQAAAATLGSVPEPGPDELELAGPDEEDLEPAESDEEYLEISHPVAPAGPDAPLDEAGDDLDIEIDLDDESPETDGAAQTTEAATLGPSASASTSQQVLEELEEAEFYLQQGMFEEAERLYERLREIAPNHPQVLVRLGELAAARGDDPGDTATGGDAAAGADPGAASDREEALDGAPLAEIPDDLDWDFPEQEIPVETRPARQVPVETRPARQVPVETRPAREVPVETPPARVAAAELTGEITSELSDSGLDGIEGIDPGDTDSLLPVPESTAEGVALEASDAAGGFDLAAEIHSALDEGGDSGASEVSSDSLAAVFREFKQGVSKTLAEGDHEAHYDLGIAYREMGLFDDAIAEFRVAMGSPQRRVDALHMMGECALEMGHGDRAVAHLELALATSTLSEEQQLPLHYGLGRAFELLGDVERARECLERVVACEPAFADAEARLARLGEKESGAAGSGFESFDDVVAELAGEADGGAGTGGARGVDFDDLVEEMNARPEAAEPRAVAPAEPEPAAAQDDPPPAPRARRRKKISFV
jgi:tetratricopeptide (TPR) repeat protein